jgi:hypothetical protein
MRPLFTGSFCPRDCDRPKAAPEPAPGGDWYGGELWVQWVGPGIQAGVNARYPDGTEPSFFAVTNGGCAKVVSLTDDVALEDPNLILHADPRLQITRKKFRWRPKPRAAHVFARLRAFYNRP